MHQDTSFRQLGTSALGARHSTLNTRASASWHLNRQTITKTMSMWGFRGTAKAFHSSETVKLDLKKEDDAGSQIPFDKFIEEFVPEFKDKTRFSLNPLLFNGTLQTLYLAKSDYSKCFPVNYARRIIDFPGPSEKFPHLTKGQTTADFVIEKPNETRQEFEKKCQETLPEGWPRLHPKTRFYTESEMSILYDEWAQSEQPIVVVCHGLAGGSHEPIIRSVSETLHSQGLDVVCLNSRGCCRSKISTPELFSALSTDDLRYFVAHLKEHFPKRALHLIGFSFGSAIVSNYLAEEGEKSLVKAAVVIGCPWDLLDSAYHVQSSLSGRRLFSPSITSFLVNLVKVNLPILSQDSAMFNQEKYNKAKKFTKMYEFDNFFTAPMMGFPTYRQYYRCASPMNGMSKIQTPLLILNSTDDPVISPNLPDAEVRQNPYLYMVATDLGGHLAYVKSDGDFWFKKPVVEFFKNMDLHVSDSKPVSGYKEPTSKFAYKVGY